jgi:hypothetical protein
MPRPPILLTSAAGVGPVLYATYPGGGVSPLGGGGGGGGEEERSGEPGGGRLSLTAPTLLPLLHRESFCLGPPSDDAGVGHETHGWPGGWGSPAMRCFLQALVDDLGGLLSLVGRSLH